MATHIFLFGFQQLLPRWDLLFLYSRNLCKNTSVLGSTRPRVTVRCLKSPFNLETCILLRPFQTEGYILPATLFIILVWKLRSNGKTSLQIGLRGGHGLSPERLLLRSCEVHWSFFSLHNINSTIIQAESKAIQQCSINTYENVVKNWQLSPLRVKVNLVPRAFHPSKERGP